MQIRHLWLLSLLFFFNDTATTEIYTLSLHDALPILPFEDRIIHCRWSGESNWIPWGDRELGVGPENATSYPHPGELALYPGGQSETELLFPYGYCSFASKAGHLWANHFATLVEGQQHLKELGRRTLWEGAQTIAFREA